jgi:chromate transporter
MTDPEAPSLLRLGWTFLKIGTFGFGGLAANLALIEQELVNRQRVIRQEEVVEALTYTKLLPGSTGVQVVSYLAWRLRAWPGALVGAAAFIAPPAASMLVIAILYGRFARLPDVSLALQGMAATIVGLLVVALWRLAQPNIVDPTAAVLAGAAFLVGYRMHLPPAWIVVLGGLIGIALEWWRKGDAP